MDWLSRFSKKYCLLLLMLSCTLIVAITFIRLNLKPDTKDFVNQFVYFLSMLLFLTAWFNDFIEDTWRKQYVYYYVCVCVVILPVQLILFRIGANGVAFRVFNVLNAGIVFSMVLLSIDMLKKMNSKTDEDDK